MHLISTWVARDCRSTDKGPQVITQINSGGLSYKTPSWGTFVARIHQLFGNEKQMKLDLEH